MYGWLNRPITRQPLHSCDHTRTSAANLRDKGIDQYVRICPAGLVLSNFAGREFSVTVPRKTDTNGPVDVPATRAHANGMDHLQEGAGAGALLLEHGERSRASTDAGFRSMVDGISGLVITVSAAGGLEFFSLPVLEYFGKTVEELRGWTAADIIHPDDLDHVIAAFTNSVNYGQPYDLVYRLRRYDAVYRWFHGRGLPLRTPEGQSARWYILLTDVDEKKRAEALLVGEKQLLEMIATGESLSVILSGLCLLVEALCPACVSCSILLLDQETKRLWHAASPSVPKDYTEAIDGFAIGPDVSSCGTAAYHGRQVIASDIATDPRWAEFRDVALVNGLRACWSTPIFSQGNRVSGTFAMFSGGQSSPTAEDQEVIAQITHLASIAIDRDRSQKSLTQALDELKMSEARLKTIIDAIPGFVWSAGPDGSVDFLNQRWCDYTGVSMADSGGSGWATTLHPDDAEQLAAQWRSSLVSGQPGEFEARFRRFDGTFRWFLIRAIPLRDESNLIVKWYGLNSDIEDRKRAESLLSAEKHVLEMVAGDCSLALILDELCKLFEATATSCYCCILLVDPRGTQLEPGAGPGVQLQYGAAPSLPAGLTEGIDGQRFTSDSFPCAMAATLNEQVISADISSEKRWDAWRPAALSHGLRAAWSTPITSGSGKILGTFAVLYEEPKTPTSLDQDLIEQFTHLASIAIERAQGETALKRSEAFLAKAQRLSLTGSFSWRVAANEIKWSEQVYRIFELDSNLPVTLELIGSRVHPEDVPLMYDMVERAQAGKDFEYEHRLQMPDGSVKHLHMIAHGAHGKEGELEFIGAVQDVTQRRLSEEALAKVQSELAHVSRVTTLGALTASITHEVNQPLSGIITNAGTCLRMLSADPPNVTGALETARRTIRDGNRAADVIARLRALFSRKDVASDPVDLNEATREVIALSSRELQRNRVILRQDLAPNLPAVTGDRVQLQQVILNLLLNASDAMEGITDRPRQMVVRTGQDEGNNVRLSVQDMGVGLSSQDPGKLFEAFYTTKSNGMGIGLSVSRAIILNHRGRIWAAPNDGPGATFSFSIPRGPRAVTGADRPGAIQTHASTEAASIMGTL